MKKMLDSEECTLSLDNYFFERPVVHKVKPLCQEASQWQLEAPPSLSQIPATQDMQKEAESLSLFGFSQKPKKFLPPLKEAAGSCGSLTNKNCSQFSQNDRYKKAQSSSLWDGEHFMDLSQGSFRSDRGEDETPMNSDQTQNRKCVTLDSSQNPQLRRSLFNPPSGQVLNSRGSTSLSSSDSISSQTARPRVQTFLRRVPMATESAPLPTAASQSSVVPRLPSRPHLLPGSVGVSAARGGQPQAKETQDKGTKRAHVFPMTPQPLQIQGNTGSLRPVSEIPAKFRSVFKDFPFFNYIQSKALDDVLYTAKNFVASAPTGSGKTVLFELAIVRLLMETSEPWRNVKAVYMAPIKALCSQRFEDWKQKFGPLGLSCKELTGDTEIDDFFEIQDAHIIMTTPEKWDSMTRKWRDNCLLQLVRLFLIDEVHVVKDPTRGATLEVVVSRMKTVRKARAGDNPLGDLSMRFVAVSATIPNISDIADWLCDEHGAATCLDMDESCRPVKLRKVVLGFSYNSNQTEFKFDLSLNYKMANIIQTYSDQKPTLVFCSTRKGVQQSATVLAKDARFIMSIDHKQRLMKYANSILDSKLRDLMMMGVGYHHAGVDVSDRKKVEEAFTLGDLPVLFTTSTLAMGVNLPAHLVVIKSTMHYIGGGCEEYSDADILQMIGRAGRPQFDTSATAVIMTKFTTKEKYMKFLNGAEIIESSLHTNLVEHLNAEIVLQTISDVNMALDWIRSTFLYIRALKNPKHYGFSVDLDRCGIEAKLQELCLKNLNSLSAINLISMDEDVNIKPTDAGRLMAQFCVAFDTMKQFSKVDGNEALPELIELIAKGKEFCDVQLRVNEKRTLNTLNKDKNRITIRYPMEGKIKSNEMKVNCLIQANLGSIPIQEFGLTQDTGRIFRNGVRISKCLAEFLNQRSKTGFSALLNSVILAKCFKAKLWENSPYVSKQLEKIGLTLSTAMVNAGITTFNKIEQTNARELELIVNRHPPFGNQIRDAVINLPKYEVSFEQLPRYNVCTAEIVVTVNLKNQEQLLSKRTAPDYHYVTLIIGDSDNNVVYLQKLKDLVLLKSGNWSKKIEVAKASSGVDICANLISSEYVGLDIQQKFSVFYSGAKRFGAEPMEPPCHTEWRVQRTPYNKTVQPRVAQAAGQRPQPSPSPQGTSRRSYAGAAYALDSYDTGKRGCNHYCKNKDLCGHECCKAGVPVVVKQPRKQVSGFSSYLQELKSKSDTLMETPVKRLKMRMVGESVSANMQQFSYKSREKLPRYGNDLFEARIHPQVVDLTEEVATPQEMAYFEDFRNEYADYLEDIYESMGVEEPAPQAQSSTVWSKPGVCNVGCPSKASVNYCPNPQPTLNPLRGYLPTSCSVSKCFNNSAVAPSLDTLTVNFDLGDEWDDWDDFEDVNLPHASEETLSACTAKTKTQGSDYNRTAYLTPVPPVQAQSKPRVSMNSAPLRSVSHPVPAEVTVRSPPLTIKPQLSTAWNTTNNKRQSVFSEEFTVKAQGTPHFETILASRSGKFDFFSKQSSNKYKQNLTGNNSLHADGSEEEAFLGIFDGIF